MPFKIIQGHRIWYQSKARMRLPNTNNTNIHPISNHFQVIADYWSKFHSCWEYLYFFPCSMEYQHKLVARKVSVCPSVKCVHC